MKHVNGITFKVNSFTTEGVSYDIYVIEEEMKKCTCPDFIWNHIACKHLYLLKRFKRNILIYILSANLPVLEMIAPVPEVAEAMAVEEVPAPSSVIDSDVFGE